MHSKVLTYQKFQTWKSATACTGAKNLKTGIPPSRTSDISKLPITRTESRFLPSVQNCTLNISNSAIFPADLRFPWSLQKSVFQSRIACLAGGISHVRAFVLVAVRERERRSHERIGEESSGISFAASPLAKSPRGFCPWGKMATLPPLARSRIPPVTQAKSRTTAVFWCSYSCVVEWTNSPSRAGVPFFFTIIRLGISDYKTKISFPHCRKMHSRET